MTYRQADGRTDEQTDDNNAIDVLYSIAVARQKQQLVKYDLVTFSEYRPMLIAKVRIEA